MSILDSFLKRNIQCNDQYHHLFTNIEKEEIDLIKEEIKKSPFIDIVLDFNDYDKITELINDVPKDHLNKDLIVEMIIRDYLYFKIIENQDLKICDVDELRKGLYSGSFEQFKNMNHYLMWTLIDLKLKDTSLAQDNKIRCHFFIDDVDDIKLQREINNLYASRTYVVLMAYTTKEGLSTYTSNMGCFIEDPHDYQTHDVKRYKN